MDLLKKDIQERLKQEGSAFAVFDFDNTCIVNDVGEAAFSFICKNGLLKDKTLLDEESTGKYHERVFLRYHELYTQGKIKEAFKLCANVYSQFTPLEAKAVTLEAIKEEGTQLGKTTVFGIPVAKGLEVRPKVLELMEFLKSQGVTIWIISASSEIAVGTAMEHFGIQENLIGVRSVVKDGRYTKQLQTPLSILEGKVDCMRETIDSKKAPLVVADDSMSGIAILETAQIKVAVQTAGELTKVAKERNWYVL